MSENRETRGRRAPIFVSMDLDHDACYRALETRDARFDGRLLHRREDHRHLLPADLPGAHAQARERRASSHRRGGAGGGLSALPALPAGDLARPRRLARHLQHRLARACADRGGRARRGRRRALADRLGVGERQLRRLFRQHLGASPIAVAQTRRVLLAKQLIHETRLPMAEVALAAGFGSVRRFNETFQQLYDRPPVALRRSGARAEPSAAGGGHPEAALPAAL